jgi:aromatic-L-amino-acid decarboxylase
LEGEHSGFVNLDPSPDEFRQWGHAATDAIAKYLESIRQRRLYPNTTSAAIREKLDRQLPVEPAGFNQTFDAFQKVIVELSRQNAHPRMFGYVQSPGTGIAAIADLLASTLNANLTAWRSAPAAVEVERLVIDWIKQLFGVDSRAAGLFVSGGSMANFAALAAARTAHAPPETIRQGTQKLTKPMCIYASREVHHSVEKAALLLGIGRDNLLQIDVDRNHRIRIDHLI